jgi:hypothetical protein
MGTISVNMSQMNRWKVYSDNVRYYDSIMSTNGKVVTLDTKPYVDLLTDFNIFYTLTRNK